MFLTGTFAAAEGRQLSLSLLDGAVLKTCTDEGLQMQGWRLCVNLDRKSRTLKPLPTNHQPSLSSIVATRCFSGARRRRPRAAAELSSLAAGPWNSRFGVVEYLTCFGKVKCLVQGLGVADLAQCPQKQISSPSWCDPC